MGLKNYSEMICDIVISIAAKIGFSFLHNYEYWCLYYSITTCLFNTQKAFLLFSFNASFR